MIRSKRRSAGFLWFCLIFPLVFISGGIAGMVDSGSGPYYNLSEFAMCFILFLLGLRFIFPAFYLFDKLTIEHETLFIKTFFWYTRKEIHLPDIQYWTEKVETERGLRYLKISIYGEQKLYTLNTRFYKNHEAIIDAVERYGYKNTEVECKLTIREKLNTSFFIFILSVVALALSVYFFFKIPQAMVTPAQLSSIKDILSEDPIVVKGSKGSSFIKFRLEHYPAFRFNISGATYNATYVDVFKQNMEQGDSIIVHIDKTEFQKKISHEVPLGFFDKTVSYTTIDVIEMAGKGLVFLNLKDYNATHVPKDNKQAALMFFILSICLILMGRQQRLKAVKMKHTLA